MTAARTPPGPAELRRRLDMDDAQLLAECDVHTHRTGGPGGQHRNKVATAIRLVHQPSGLIATAGETRSQHENKHNALRRLREMIAVHVRCPAPEGLAWPPTVHVVNGHLRIRPDNPGYPHALGLALDVLEACGGRASEAGKRLSVSTSSLVRFLADHPLAWVEAARIRKQAGLGPLSA